MKPFRRIIKTKEIHPLFNVRKVRTKYEWSEKIWETTEYQCPICKVWFNSETGYGRYNTSGVRLHITKIAKTEAVALLLKEIKRAPHFDFWKKHTQPINILHKPRDWKIY